MVLPSPLETGNVNPPGFIPMGRKRLHRTQLIGHGDLGFPPGGLVVEFVRAGRLFHPYMAGSLYMSLELFRIRMSRPLHGGVSAEGVCVGGKLCAVRRRGTAHPGVVVYRIGLDGRQSPGLGGGNLVHLCRLALRAKIGKEILR